MRFSPKSLVFTLFIIGLSILLSCTGGLTPSPVENPQTSNPVQLPKTSSPRFGIPIDCTLDKDCFIMHYVDRDPTPEVVDFGCGRQTYDGHNGVDFGISDLQVMAKGVAVKSAAAGTVLRVRDGMGDRLIEDQTDKASVADQECGNGIVIDHGNGWETQYCHLRNGSVSVKPGMQVQKGTVLGMIGSSGLASFPHVHLTIRYQKQVIDPFVGVNSNPGCQVSRNPIWDQPLDYVPTGLIRAGFATTPPNQQQLWQGQFSTDQLPQDLPALVFWVHAYGVLQGDIESFKVITPDGQVLINQEKSIEKPYRSWVSYVGKRNTSQAPIKTGVWRGEYQLKRGDRPVFQLTRQITVNN